MLSDTVLSNPYTLFSFQMKDLQEKHSKHLKMNFEMVIIKFAKFESFRALMLSKPERFRALKLLYLESFRALKLSNLATASTSI